MGERAGQSGSISNCHHSSVAQSFELDSNDEVTTDVGHESLCTRNEPSICEMTIDYWFTVPTRGFPDLVRT